MVNRHVTERIDTVVIGAGQAGLSAGYHLKQRGVPFVILDARARIGDVWRERWDSLRLFTPARYAGLDGLPFPAADRHYFPTKDEMGDYLEQYARRFSLPVRTGVRVDRLSRMGDRFLVVAGDTRYEADHVVVAMSNYQRPRVPAFARDLAKDIRQIHSLDYKNQSQLQPGGVLIVGGGNSGAEIAIESARQGHKTFLVGPHPGHVPFRIEGLAARLILVTLVLRVVFHRILSVATPIGRRARRKMLHGAGPLVRTKPNDIKAAGVSRLTARVAGVRQGRPALDDGRVLDIANVVWCTGFHPGFSWIDLPIFDDRGDPRHERGIVSSEPGLYFVGLHFQYALSSGMIHGVGRDAARVVAAIAARTRMAPAQKDARPSDDTRRLARPKAS